MSRSTIHPRYCRHYSPRYIIFLVIVVVMVLVVGVVDCVVVVVVGSCQVESTWMGFWELVRLRNERLMRPRSERREPVVAYPVVAELVTPDGG